MNEQLQQLVTETCRHPPGSLERQRNLTKLILVIKQSKKLWQENTPYYQDALQQTWIYFCQNLCEASTGARYNPTRSSIFTWLNCYLKWRLQDFRLANQAEKARTTTGKNVDGEKKTDPIENIAASADIPPILENTQKWAETDPEGELSRIHIQDYPAVTCQILILHRLPPETTWKDLSAEFGIPVSTMSNFYRRQCMPRLRKFAKSEGYI